MQFNLNTTINAFPQISPSILSNYVTQNQLSTTLNNYVEEAPNDSSVYGRQNKQWVELNEQCVLNNITLSFGYNDLVEIQQLSDISSLESVTLDKNTTSYNLTYNQQSSGYFWIVSTRKILNIMWMNMLADYVEQPSNLITNNGLPLYCYRMANMLIPQQLNFTINF